MKYYVLLRFICLFLRRQSFLLVEFFKVYQDVPQNGRPQGAQYKRARQASETLSKSSPPLLTNFGPVWGGFFQVVEADVICEKHGRKAWGVQRGRRRPQAARPADGPPLKQP
jgi:hypothetical protein